jgi:hypothetical protein
MVATYDLETDIGTVRLLTGIETDTDQAIMEDAEIQKLIDLEGDLKLAAAQVCDLIANSEVMITKMVSLLDLRTNGPAVADSLRKHADRLRAQGNADFTGDFDIAEEPDTVFGYRNLYAKLYLPTVK